MTVPLRLGVLDQSPVAEGGTGAEALRNSIDLAGLADRLGYERYWVAEHHGTPMLAGAAPEVLIAEIASTTPSIRVGSGGVMLPHYSPLKVAETFSILGGLHGDRIDLGIGRAPGSDRETMFALQRDRRQYAPDDSRTAGGASGVPRERLPADHPLARLTALPGSPGRPDVWLLGSSPQSAIWAAELGLPCSIAEGFINPAGAEELLNSIASGYGVSSTRTAGGHGHGGGDLPRPTTRPPGSPRASAWRSRCSGVAG